MPLLLSRPRWTRFITNAFLFSFLSNPVAVATPSYIELDFKGDQTPHRLHVMPRLSSLSDVSHLQLDFEAFEARVYKFGTNQSQGGNVTSQDDFKVLERGFMTIPDYNVLGLPWHLKDERLKTYLSHHTAWLSQYDDMSYKLTFTPSLLGGGNSGSSGGGGGGQCPNSYYECDSHGQCMPVINICASPDSTPSDTGRSYGKNYDNRDTSAGEAGYPSQQTQGMSCTSSKNSRGESRYIVYSPLTGLCTSTLANTLKHQTRNQFLPHTYCVHPLDLPIEKALVPLIKESFERVLKVSDPNRKWFCPHYYERILSPLFYMVRTEVEGMLQAALHGNYSVDIKAWERHFHERVAQHLQHMWSAGGLEPHHGVIHAGPQAQILTKLESYTRQYLQTGLRLLKDGCAQKPLALRGKNGEVLTLDFKKHLAIATPKHTLVYPLFAQDRLLADTYLPVTFKYHSFDQALWQCVHAYVKNSLPAVPQARCHLEPAFYLARTTLDAAIQQAGRSNVYTTEARAVLEQKLQEAIKTHLMLTPLALQDKTANITKTLAPRLFEKGLDLYQASQMSLINSPSAYTLTANVKGQLSSVCPWNGLVYPVFPDERRHAQAFFPQDYLRSGWQTYLEDFLNRSTQNVNFQDKNVLRHALSPVAYMTRQSFQNIPIKTIDFPSQEDAAVLLLGITADAMFGDVESVIHQAQTFFGKPLPFEKLNLDLLVHQHLCQHMFPKEWQQEKGALGDQYWKTVSPIAPWGILAQSLEAVASHHGIAGARIYPLIQMVEAIHKGGFEYVSKTPAQRQVFLDQHVAEGFGRDVARWSGYKAEITLVARRQDFGSLDPLEAFDVMVCGRGGGKLNWNRALGKYNKTPGLPTVNDGFVAPKNWNGKLVKNPNGKGYGYPDKDGNVWVPTGVGGSQPGTTGIAHGGAHWDVQLKNGKHQNVYPGGKTR